MAENVLELAFRGRPVDSFYMVGRMGDQRVVIRAETENYGRVVDLDRKADELTGLPEAARQRDPFGQVVTFGDRGDA